MDLLRRELGQWRSAERRDDVDSKLRLVASCRGGAHRGCNLVPQPRFEECAERQAFISDGAPPLGKLGQCCCEPHLDGPPRRAVEGLPLTVAEGETRLPSAVRPMAD